MALKQDIHGQYLCFYPKGAVQAAMILHLKTEIFTEIDKHHNDIAIALDDVNELDSTALRFFTNMQKAVKKKGKRLVFFGGQSDLRELLIDGDQFVVYGNYAEFEKAFHEINPDIQATLLKLAIGDGPVRGLRLQCPLCGCDDVSGFVLMEDMHVLQWMNEDIPPMWIPKGETSNAMDFDYYRVSVCPECYYAAARMDWFNITLPEGSLECILSRDQRDRIGKHAAARRDISAGISGMDTRTFFAMPRETRASYLSWKLFEETLRHMARDRSNTDAFEIAESNFMMCKFAPSETVIKQHLGTAQAWVQNILQESRERYSTQRIVAAYTYAVSVNLALGKARQAREFHQQFMEEYGEDPLWRFYTDRSRYIMEDD